MLVMKGSTGGAGDAQLNRAFLVDFESAVIKSFMEKFPETSIRCSRFHFGQSILRKIRELGLISEYKNCESRIEYWLKHIYG